MGLYAEAALPHVAHTTPARRYDIRAAAAWARLVARADPEGAAEIARASIAEGIPVRVGAAGMPYVTLAMTRQIVGDNDAARRELEAGQRAVDASDVRPFERAAILWSASTILATAGAADEAREKAETALTIARETRSPTALTLSLFALAYSAWETDPEVDLAAVEECIALTRAGAADGAFGVALVIAARLRTQQGDIAAGIAGAREGIDYTRSVGDLSNLSYALHDSVLLVTQFDRPAIAAEIAGALDTGARCRTPTGRASPRGAPTPSPRRAPALGDEEFAAATRRGATMTYDDIALRAVAELAALLES